VEGIARARDLSWRTLASRSEWGFGVACEPACLWTFFLRLSSEAPRALDFDRVERESGIGLNLEEDLSARLLRDRLDWESWRRRDSWDEPTWTSTSMGSGTSTETSLEEEDTGLSAVRESSCPLKEERASGDDRVEDSEETEGAGSMDEQGEWGMIKGDTWGGVDNDPPAQSGRSSRCM